MRTHLLLFAFLNTLLFSVHGQSLNRYAIIPRPAQLTPHAGEFSIKQGTLLTVPGMQPELKRIADQFVQQIAHSTGLVVDVQVVTQLPLDAQTTGSNMIQFVPVRDTTLSHEGYRIDVGAGRITVEANAPSGFFYAVQTLYQLLPPVVLSHEPRTPAVLPAKAPGSLLLALPIPACQIQDRPRYSYRGMHLDVSRHFFSVAFIKKYLDLMALHKFNQFHWHLTDDQGWRIDIKRYPKLTSVGAHRRETIVGHYDDDNPQRFDGKPYGGFYTQDEVREVVRYAATKYINVIPEIELPGHALAALASYPTLSCNPGEPYQVATKWGVFDDVYCPTEDTFTFLENVLSEVINLFPSLYIHIGGDECPTATWRHNAFCQQLIKRLKLKDEHELQLYIVARIDKFVTSKGRRIIGWDEILEGNGPRISLSPDATVMSWRSVTNGIKAARQQHDVIMTPGKFCYFDHYQGDPAQEPTAFGGSLPLALVYGYDPTPTGLSATEASHILGAQGNLWTEYIATAQHAEYMLWPRAAALAEVVWTPLVQKDYDDFLHRLTVHFERLDNLDVHYSRTVYDALPIGKATPEGEVSVTISADKSVPQIRYTVDGSVPSAMSPLYDKPLLLTTSATVRTATFDNDSPLGQRAKIQQEYVVSKATGKQYTLLNAPIGSRPDRSANLTDGTLGSMGGYDVMDVVVFKNDINVIVDLGKEESVETVRMGFLRYPAKTICLPRQVEVALSTDGKIFTPVFVETPNVSQSGKRSMVRLLFHFAPTSTRYVRLIARNWGRVPAGLRGAGKPTQLAADEIEVR